MREPPRLFLNLLCAMICCICFLTIFLLAELHQYAVTVTVTILAFGLVMVAALVVVLIMRDLNKQEIKRQESANAQEIKRTESVNEQGLRHRRARYREELPLDEGGVPLYLPADAQPNPQFYRSAPIYQPQPQQRHEEGGYGYYGE